MRWWTGRSAPQEPDVVPLDLPDLAGGGWPDPATVGRPGFATATYRELGVRYAHDLEAHAVADALEAALVPHLPVATTEQDAPYLHKALVTAVRLGAGLAAVERTLSPPPLDAVDRQLAAALWLTRRDLAGGLAPDAAAAAAYLLLAGFWVARRGPELVDVLRRDLPG